jgi:pimeloyl-ACP methyl ester carboxylesterase
MMCITILLSSQVMAVTTMFGMSTCAMERRIEIPLEQSGGLPVAELVSALAQAHGVTVERPASTLTLPTQGLAGSLTKTLLGECLGPEVRLVFRPGVVVITVDEEELRADRGAEWKRRLDELSARSLQAASRHQYYGIHGLASYHANDTRRPTVCLVHGINSSSGSFVHVIPLLESAGYGVVVFDYPYNQRLDDSCAQFRRDWIAFRKTAGESLPWAILAHSMGALVARSYVEAEGRTDRDVASMILIAPVNQGAHVAKIQPVFQTISSLSAINGKRTAQALAQLSDGIGQAADDLLPGSAFLKRINGGSKPRDVPYHILAGNSGLIPRDIRQQAQAQLETASRDNGFFSFFSRAASREIIPLLDELTDGSGDGCVAVERTRLEGADDHVTIRANHAELIRAPLLYPDEGPVPCMPYVLLWLRSDLKRKVD